MERPTRLPSREQLLYWLHEASEIEHQLMCCYLYAAFSLKRADPRWTSEQEAAVKRWRASIVSVALEEMTHLALVGNLTSALGGTPNLNRPNFPVDSGPYPAGFVIRLQPFSAETIEHFQFLERPASEQDRRDAEAFAPTEAYRREVPEGRLSPGPRDYATVGELYETLLHSLEAVVAASGDQAVFCGDPALQVDATLAPLPGVVPVTDLASARRAILTIVTQGEGAGDEVESSHYSRFTRIADELAALTAADPSFEPAWPAAKNPVMNRPVQQESERVHIREPRIAAWLDIGNALYTTSLRCLLQGFAAEDRRSKATWLACSFALMRGMAPVGEGLAARPAGEVGGPHAGLTFTSLRTLATLPDRGAARFVAERLEQLRERALTLPVVPVAGETPSTWQSVIDLLSAQRDALLELAGTAAPAEPEAPRAKPSLPVAAPPPPKKVEVVEGSKLTLLFEGRRCIHSRHCVLDAPRVFLANTPGDWIYPDAMSAEALVAVAHSCPSGAIRYERHDGGEPESAPEVNQLRIRENGPYAVHAPLVLAGKDDGFRATLCRCGHSANKPWCDGSHVAAEFVASGEPKSGATDPLASRGGALEVTPMLNGPLRVRGNLEICAGTGRTVARVTEAKLCRCGQSKNKPFCDLSHVAAGFEADGDT